MTKQKDKDKDPRHHQGSHGHENSGGEPSKHAQALHADAARDQQAEIDVDEGHDHKKGNIGPSGQGSHRGRERDNKQSKASGRSNVASSDNHVHH
ncbi:MAG: hypothetical protein H7318_16790 [Oligoflexus sp.]|nr:hypothetical protein [Oligoflexus sp.]